MKEMGAAWSSRGGVVTQVSLLDIKDVVYACDPDGTIWRPGAGVIHKTEKAAQRCCLISQLEATRLRLNDVQYEYEEALLSLDAVTERWRSTTKAHMDAVERLEQFRSEDGDASAN